MDFETWNYLFIQSRNAVVRSLDLPDGWLHGLLKLYRKSNKVNSTGPTCNKVG